MMAMDQDNKDKPGHINKRKTGCKLYHMEGVFNLGFIITVKFYDMGTGASAGEYPLTNYVVVVRQDGRGGQSVGDLPPVVQVDGTQLFYELPPDRESIYISDFT